LRTNRTSHRNCRRKPRQFAEFSIGTPEKRTPPLKSTDVYSILRSEMASTMKVLGFRRQRAFLSWSRQTDGLNTVVWCQVSRDGWDQYAGSKFVLEFQRSEGNEPGMPAKVRARFAKLVGPEIREEVRALQNEVISSLQRPPSNYATLHVSPEITRWYMQQFERENNAFGAGEDLWFRYAAPAHVQRWAQLIVRHLPILLQHVENGA
jgi:hypothetical protein